MGTQSDFRVKKNLIVGDGTISSGDNANLVLRRDFDDTTYNQITLSDDTFKITLDNSDRFFIDGTGKVGLGVTSPSERLDIRNPTSPKLLVRTTASSSQEAHIIIGGARTTSTTADISRVIFNTYDSDIGGSESNTLAEITVRKQTASSDQGNLLFKTNSGDNSISEAMRIDKDGNVGIGTTSPAFPLEVDGFISTASGIVHTGDTNNTITFGTDTQSFNTDSTTRMHITSAGNVGIGTTAPIMGLADSIQLNVHNPTSRKRSILQLSSGSSTDGDVIGSIFFSNSDNADATNYDADSKYVAAIETIVETDDSNASDDSGAHMKFLTKPNAGAFGERMRITSAGDVGIGVTDPDKALEVNSGSTNLGGIKITGSGVNTSLTIDNTGTNGGKYRMSVTSGSHGDGTNKLLIQDNNTARMVLNSAGNIGIGVTSPSTRLHLKTDNDSNFPQLKIDNAGTGDAALFFTAGSVWSMGVDNSDSDKFKISQDDSNAYLHTNTMFTIDTSGKVGIGASSPGYMLDIQAGSAHMRLKDTSDTDDMYITYHGSDSNEYGFIGYSGTSVFQIKSAQGRVINLGGHANVKVGVTTADMTFTPSALFHVNGALKATTKSFDIEHPTKEGMRLHHGALEGPEHGVYIRGHQVGETIELPDYWLGLVDEDTITVQLTAKGRTQNLYVKSVDREKVVVGGFLTKSPDFYYFIQAERKDVDKMEVEYDKLD